MKICKHNDGLGHCGIYAYGDYCVKGACADRELIECLPVVHGHWIKVGETDSDGNSDYLCSACGSRDCQAVSKVVPYCWNCGAIMDEKSENQ